MEESLSGAGRDVGDRREPAQDLDGISRAEQDELAVSSHQRAVAAQKDGILAEEIIPVAVRTRQGEELVDTDEIRGQTPRWNLSVSSNPYCWLG